MKTFALGVAIGYVLGTRAGRERYDQLIRAYHAVIDHPLTQGVAGMVRAKLGRRGAHSAREQTPFARQEPVDQRGGSAVGQGW